MPRVEIFRNVRKSGERLRRTAAVGKGETAARGTRLPRMAKPGRRAWRVYPRDSSSTDSALLDLVEQRLVADAENLRGLAPVPVHLSSVCSMAARSAFIAAAFATAASEPPPSSAGSISRRLHRPRVQQPEGTAESRAACRTAAPQRQRPRPRPAARRRPSPPPARQRARCMFRWISRTTSCSSCRMTTRLIMFSSSRMLPGHSYWPNSCRSSSEIGRAGRLYLRE